MRPASSPRFLLPCAITALLVACQQIEPQILVNRSAHPIHVRISHPTEMNGSSQRYACRYGPTGGSLQMATEEPTRSNDYVALVLTATDPSKCEVEFDLPAGYKVVIDLNSTCDDYPKQPAEQRSPLPFPSALRIEGKEGIIDLNGWQVARQFKRQKDDSCLLVYE